MSRTAGAVFAAALVLMAVATGALAKAPELEGKFKVTATIGANDFGVDQGTKTQQTYKFRCANASCRKVKLTRIDPGGKYKPTLEKSSPTYKGTEGPYPYPSCPDNNAATFTVDHKVKVSDSKDGEATKISGTAATKIQNCDAFTFVDYKIKGKLK